MSHGGRPRATETMQRDAEALRLHSLGLTYQQITDQTGYWGHASGAFHAVRRAIGDSYRLPRAEAIEEETQRLAHLDRVLNKVIAGGGRDQDVIAACQVLLRVAESRRKLLGYDQPARRTVELTTITEDVVDAEIKRLEDRLGAPG